jgi:hypothetical protein
MFSRHIIVGICRYGDINEVGKDMKLDLNGWSVGEIIV